MTGSEAVELIRLIEPRLAVPVHYEGWSHFREPLTELGMPPPRSPRGSNPPPVADPPGSADARGTRV